MTITKYFSRPLIKQTLRSNLILTIAVLLWSCIICFVLTFAMSEIEGSSSTFISTMIDQMYYREIGLLPMLVWTVVVSNSVIANQVDRGSMVYVLSTPTRRSAVVITQATYTISLPFVIITAICCIKLIGNAVFLNNPSWGSTIVLYLGMFFLIESMCGISYLGSCLFNRSSRAMAFGGAFVVWFFIAALVGMFGLSTFVSSNMGVEALNVFNYLTLMSLFDIDSIATVGTQAVDLAFLWKFAILIVIAIVTYVSGAIYFTKKDLPL